MKGIVTISVTLVAIAALCGAGLCAQAGPNDPANPQAVANSGSPAPNHADLAQSSAAARNQAAQAASPIPKMVGQAPGAQIHQVSAKSAHPVPVHPIHGASELQPGTSPQVLSQRLGQPSSEASRPAVAVVPAQPASALAEKNDRPVAVQPVSQTQAASREVRSEVIAAPGRCPECPPCPPAVRSDIKADGSGAPASPARSATKVPEQVQAMPAQAQSPVNVHQDKVQQQGASPIHQTGGALTVQPVGAGGPPTFRNDAQASYGYNQNPQLQPVPSGNSPTEGMIRPGASATPGGAPNWNPQMGAGHAQQQPAAPGHGFQQMGPQVQQPTHQQQTSSTQPPQTGQFSPQTTSSGPQVNQLPSQPTPPPPQPGQYTPAPQQQNSWQPAPATAGPGVR